MASREKETARFHTVTDKGKEYTVLKYQTYLSVASHDKPRGEIEVSDRLITSAGLAVDCVDAETFKIVSTGEIIRKVL